jgi:FkbM family methyltransferase
MSGKTKPIGLGARLIRSVVKTLPERAQRAAAKRYFFGQIKAGAFRSDEDEWASLPDWLEAGDWCIDVGANIGRYSLRMSELVGPTGQVIAFEPLTKAFELLTHFVEKGKYKNITLLNAAATEKPSLIGITPQNSPIPFVFDTNTGTSVSAPDAGAGETKLGLSLDALNLPHKVKLIKIDVEGHELSVCKGMAALLKRDHPRLIVEDQNPAIKTGVAEFLAQFGYDAARLSDQGRNLVFTKRP